MSLNRRQFLILSGALGGLGLSILAQRLMAEGQSTTAERLPTLRPTPVPQAELSRSSAVAQSPNQGTDPTRGDVRIVVISDFNSQYGSTEYEPEVDKAIALIPQWQPDLVIGGGDMVAGQRTSLSTQNIQAMWASFDRHVAAPLRAASIPFGFTIGNHDGSGAVASGRMTFQRERQLAAAHWNDSRYNPGLQFVDRANYPFYYSFQQNQIYYLVWDASAAQMPAQQLAWVERSLASSAAQNAPMRIVIGHLPLYAVAVGRDRPGEIFNNADQLRSLLERYHVHTYISGHHHAYFPGHRGQLQLLHAGAIGSGPRQLVNSNLPPRKTVTIVDINLNAETTTYTTYDVKTMALIDQQQLPRIITGPNGFVLRQDMTCSTLPPTERSTCSE